MQLGDVKYCLKGHKFWNGIRPSSYKDYHFQDGQVMLQGLFCIPSSYCSANSTGSCMRLEVKGQAVLDGLQGYGVGTHVYQFLFSFDSK